MGEPMTIDDVRARLEAGRYAHNEDALWADLRALLDDHARLAAEVARLAAALAGYEGKPCGRRDCASARADAREEVERLTRERELRWKDEVCSQCGAWPKQPCPVTCPVRVCRVLPCL